MLADFYKYHALGNDYIVIDPAKTNINLDENAIKLICHRNFGVGSDGILYGPLSIRAAWDYKFSTRTAAKRKRAVTGYGFSPSTSLTPVT